MSPTHAIHATQENSHNTIDTTDTIDKTAFVSQNRIWFLYAVHFLFQNYCVTFKFLAP